MMPQRIYSLNDAPVAAGPVVYWMSRDQRVADNWALVHAQALALERRVPLTVVFTLAPAFLGATLRQYAFMLRGLVQTARRLADLSIPFQLLHGEPADEICRFTQLHHIGAVVTDFDPLRIKRAWREEVARRLEVAVIEVDTHNIVPCRLASAKQEFGAYTIRPKIQRLLPDFLHEFPTPIRHPIPWASPTDTFSIEPVLKALAVDHTVPEVAWLPPGEAEGHERLATFIAHGLASYDSRRNDPCVDGQSGLSPYLHFGQLAPQRVALEVRRHHPHSPSAQAFLEELIVRRELSDNFCLYNPFYDSVQGFPAWGVRSHDEHRHDRREYVYSREQFTTAATHDPLWNAAQREMVTTGKMHGYLRMYWAKKILEWTPTPEDAMATAIYLNDRYQLDGRDPNGYAGIAWSIGGVHDRAWGNRPVFGKIRYMNAAGCARKFDVREYIRRYQRDD
ncbi:deoxyribodipyrimidine photo-lyase [Geobacter sp. AOG1]|uniref:deoxyribodipyrimidine photo-lyase n=1 Tax=Geobacter sp. AOG1 TaxID=1566346 RepID=UPI001CC348D1|nr:deoxyribodipyrimidine photo-lyase [Geobacter sp. AOG1]GFE58910.1 deoxyribodipyrimidine photo-lyase [Geobacter sp. AOG1]